MIKKLIDVKNLDLVVPGYNSVSSSFKTKALKTLMGNKFINIADNIRHFHILNNINFSMKAGERIGIIGKNGSGKTSFLRLLSGIYKPTKGQIIFNSKITPLLDISLGLDSEATGLENIFLRGYILGMKKDYITERLEEIISFSELKEKIYQPMRIYSLGMSMRLAFSISTCIAPEVLVMDEWISVGDESFIKKANIRLNQLVEQSSGFILASHSMEQIKKLCTRVIYMNSGRIIVDDNADVAIKAYHEDI
jgi:lipopolysaccharide transport system ATP-binding protein